MRISSGNGRIFDVLWGTKSSSNGVPPNHALTTCTALLIHFHSYPLFSQSPPELRPRFLSAGTRDK